MSKLFCKTCPHGHKFARSTNDNIFYVTCDLAGGERLTSFYNVPAQCRRIEHICDKCAKMLLWVWPDGHVATFHVGPCDVCGKTVTVTDARDYLVPEAKGAILK